MALAVTSNSAILVEGRGEASFGWWNKSDLCCGLIAMSSAPPRSEGRKERGMAKNIPILIFFFI